MSEPPISRNQIDAALNYLKYDGARAEFLLSYCVTLRRLALDETKILSDVLAANVSQCSPPLDEAAVGKLVQGVFKYQSVKRDESSEPLNDSFTAKWFLSFYAENIRCCAALGGWHCWTGRSWAPDNTFEIKRRLMAALVKMREKARLDSDRKLLAFEKASGSSSKIDAALNLARAGEGISLQADDFDRDEWLLNFANGTLNLETMNLQSHARADLITREIAHPFDPAAPAPEWEKFLKFIFNNDADTIAFVQRAVGYALCGSTREQCLFILYGAGSNGKSTFLKHISSALSQYAMDTPASSFIEKYQESIPNDIARLKGARFVTSVESGRSKQLDEAKIKQLTGGDRVTARFLHQEFFEFVPTFKIFFATNHKPEIRGTDKGIWRRIKTIPFERTIEDNERDFGIDAKLAAEYPGILAWAVRGFQDWFNGGGLRAPEKIVQATAIYQEESDVLGSFIEECCILKPSLECPAADLQVTLREWLDKNAGRKIHRAELNEYLISKNITKNKVKSGANRDKICWEGIGLKSSRAEEPPARENWQDAGRPF